MATTTEVKCPDCAVWVRPGYPGDHAGGCPAVTCPACRVQVDDLDTHIESTPDCLLAVVGEGE